MRKVFVLGLLLLVPPTAYANLVWPALYLEARLFSWWAISVGLAVEYLFVRRLFAMSPRRAALADLSANAFSAVAGVVLIPLAGIAWELILGSLYMWVLDWGTFNPITWGATFLLACFINALVEGLVYKNAFKVELFFKSKKFGWLVLANVFGVGVALVGLWMVPVRL